MTFFKKKGNGGGIFKRGLGILWMGLRGIHKGTKADSQRNSARQYPERVWEELQRD
jgi:hypothetical protein